MAIPQLPSSFKVSPKTDPKDDSKLAEDMAFDADNPVSKPGFVDRLTASMPILGKLLSQSGVDQQVQDAMTLARGVAELQPSADVNAAIPILEHLPQISQDILGQLAIPLRTTVNAYDAFMTGQPATFTDALWARGASRERAMSVAADRENAAVAKAAYPSITEILGPMTAKVYNQASSEFVNAQHAYTEDPTAFEDVYNIATTLPKGSNPTPGRVESAVAYNNSPEGKESAMWNTTGAQALSTLAVGTPMLLGLKSLLPSAGAFFLGKNIGQGQGQDVNVTQTVGNVGSTSTGDNSGPSVTGGGSGVTTTVPVTDAWLHQGIPSQADRNKASQQAWEQYVAVPGISKSTYVAPETPPTAPQGGGNASEVVTQYVQVPANETPVVDGGYGHGGGASKATKDVSCSILVPSLIKKYGLKGAESHVPARCLKEFRRRASLSRSTEKEGNDVDQQRSPKAGSPNSRRSIPAT